MIAKLVRTSSKAMRVGIMIIIMYLSVVEDTTSVSDSGMDAEAKYVVLGKRSIAPKISSAVGFRALGRTQIVSIAKGIEILGRKQL